MSTDGVKAWGAGRRRRLVAAAAVLVLAVTASACQYDVDVLGYGLQHTGDDLFESTLTTANVGELQQQWTGPLTSYLDMAPMVATDVTVGSQQEDLVFEGDEQGVFDAFDADTGALVWQQHLGAHLGGAADPDCADSWFGLSSTPVIDRSTDTIYAVDGNDLLYAFDLGTGAEEPGWPLPLSTEPATEHVWSGLTLDGDTLYVPIASDCDDPPYQGRLVAVDTATATVTNTFDVEGDDGLSGGGIWGWGGVSVAPSGQNLYVATGNTLGSDSSAGYGDAVVELSAGDLAVEGSNAPPSVPQGDWDFGGVPVLFQAPGCPAMLAVENKSGNLYVYDQGQLDAGPVQTLAVAQPDGNFIGDPAWDLRSDTLFVADSSSAPGYPEGLLSFSVSAGCQLVPGWQTPLGSSSSVMSDPTVADGVVYFADGSGGTVYAVDEASGAVLWSWQLPAPVFAPLTVANGMLYVPCWNSQLYAFGLPSTVAASARHGG